MKSSYKAHTHTDIFMYVYGFNRRYDQSMSILKKTVIQGNYSVRVTVEPN